MREFSFVLNKNLLALTERKWFFRVYTAFVVKLRVSKESKACQILPIVTFECCSSFPVLLFSSFSSLWKRYQITEFRSHVHYSKILHWSALIPVLLTNLTLSAFAWRDLSDLDHPLDWAWAFVNWVWPRYGHTRKDGSGQWPEVPNVNFRKISVRKTI